MYETITYKSPLSTCQETELSDSLKVSFFDVTASLTSYAVESYTTGGQTQLTLTSHL